MECRLTRLLQLTHVEIDILLCRIRASMKLMNVYGKIIKVKKNYLISKITSTHFSNKCYQLTFIVKRLDAGCFGEVSLYELYDSTNSNRPKPVAVKSLADTGRTLDLLKVLCSELKMMMLVQELGSHPNIITFIGASTKYFQKSELIYLYFT
jgi:hypothetical protein